MTFHRAFDVAQDAFKAVEIIKELGFSRLLTSGQVCTIFQYFEPSLMFLHNYYADRGQRSRHINDAF